MNISEYTSKEFRFIKEMNKNLLIDRAEPSPTPKAYILGGQSGAGKSKLHLLAGKETEENIIVIDGDTFRRGHPNSKLITKEYGKSDVKYTAKFAGQMVEELVADLSDSHYNLLIEGTLRTAEVPLDTAKMLNEKGYDTELLVMTVHPLLSYLGTISRYEEAFFINPDLARATPKDHHDLIVKNLPDNLDTLYLSGAFTNIRLINRQGDTLYSLNETPNLSPKDVFKQTIESKLTKEEVNMATSNISRAIELIEQRDTHDEEVQFTMNELVMISESVSEYYSETIEEKSLFSNKTHHNRYEPEINL